MLEVLVFMMVSDYISGVLSALFGKSDKSSSGHLSSKVGFKGIAKKGMMLLICSIAYRLDILTQAIQGDGNAIMFSITCIFYISNEAISILENADKLDLPVPDKLKTFIHNLVKEE